MQTAEAKATSREMAAGALASRILERGSSLK
jgi:hypothetical protein